MQRMRVVSAARAVMSAHMHFHMPHVRERHLDQRGLPPEGLGSFRRNFHGGTFPFEGEGLGVVSSLILSDFCMLVFVGVSLCEGENAGLTFCLLPVHGEVVRGDSKHARGDLRGDAVR